MLFGYEHTITCIVLQYIVLVYYIARCEVCMLFV